MQNNLSASFIMMISDLPINIIQNILMLLPMRDMVRTSILSRSWRSQWKKVPQLVFEDETLPSLSHEDKCRSNMEKVFGVLLLHHGPILKFSLDMTTCSGIDQIISFLSRNGIQDLTLLTKINNDQLLPSSILSCVELRHLSLGSFVFQPLNLAGFNKLVSLELLKVEWTLDISISSCPSLESLKLHNRRYFDRFSVDAPNLKILIFKGCFRDISYMNTPNLRVLSLTGKEDYNWNQSMFDLMKFIQSLPLLENLHLYYRYLKLVQPTPPSVDFEPEVYTHSCQLKLQEVEIVLHNGWSDLRHGKEFLKFLLPISPELKTLHVKSGSGLIDDSGYKVLVELGCYPRASAKARIIYVGLKL